MKKNAFKYLIVSLILSCISMSCDKEDEIPANVYERIKGTWSIDETNMLGIKVPGYGSTLTFDYCDEPPCTGKDYDALEETTGSFTYEFIEDESKILITDNDVAGGNYNASWEILDFDKDDLRITADLGILGNMQLKMTK